VRKEMFSLKLNLDKQIVALNELKASNYEEFVRRFELFEKLVQCCRNGEYRKMRKYLDESQNPEVIGS